MTEVALKWQGLQETKRHNLATEQLDSEKNAIQWDSNAANWQNVAMGWSDLERKKAYDAVMGTHYARQDTVAEQGLAMNATLSALDWVAKLVKLFI